MLRTTISRTRRVAPAATRRLATLPTSNTIFINNEYRSASDGSVMEVHNPATGEILTSVANGTFDDVEDAVSAARSCFEGAWGRDNTTVEERVTILKDIAARLSDPDTLEHLAQVESMDCGKTVGEARGDMEMCASAFNYYAGIAPQKLAPMQLPKEEDGYDSKVVHDPIGVAGLVTPWNYPLMQAVLKVAPALAAGNTVVLKPSPWASLTCSMLGGIAKDAGLPAGALNVITGGPPGGDAGQYLIDHPELDVLSFTGSGPTGNKILRASAEKLRRSSLELGGKGALIVFEDAQLDVAVDWAMCGIFLCTGQVCSATSRLLVHEDIAEEMLARLKEKTSALKVGHPMAEGTMMGPVVSSSQYDKVLGAISQAQAEGAKLLVGGGRPELPDDLANGYYIQPTILTEVSVDNSAWREEIFGPVLSVRTFKDEAEAIAAANDSHYGLAHAVLSQDEKRARRVGAQLDAGVVWQNCNQALHTSTPFGGKKMSGFGWELGEAGLMEYVSCRTIVNAAPGTTWNYFA